MKFLNGWTPLLTIFALTAGLTACSVDAPNKTPPNSGDESSETPLYTVGGRLEGLSYGQIKIKVQSEVLTLQSNGEFQFRTTFEEGDAFNVTIEEGLKSPTKSCTLTGGSGSIGQENINNIVVTCPSVQEIQVKTTRTKLPIGSEATLSALALFNDNTTADITSWTTWNVSDANILGLTGLRIIGQTSGTAQVVGSFSNFSQQKNIEVPNLTVTNLSISPSLPTLSVGSQRELKIIAYYDNGSQTDVSKLASITPSNPSIMTSPSLGTLRGEGPGSTNLVVSFNGYQKTVVGLVSSATVVDIDITPSFLNLQPLATAPLIATGLYSDGSTRDITSEVNWTSLDSTTATISNLGLVTALKNGIADITATLGSSSSSTTVRVSNRALVSLSIVGPSHIPKLFAANYSLQAEFDDGSIEIVDSQASWSLSETNFAFIQQQADYRQKLFAEEVGALTITAIYSGQSATKTVEITNETLSSIQVSPGALIIAKGMNFKCSATGVFSNGTQLDITDTVTWSTSNTALAEIINGGLEAGQLTNKANGTGWQSFLITATKDSITTSQKISITPATLTGLTFDKTNIQLKEFSKLNLKTYGLFSDGGGVDLTALVNYRTDNKNTARVSNALTTKGDVSGINLGSAQITAEISGTSTNASVEVINGSSSNGLSGIGLRGDYYIGKNFETFAGSRIDTTINFNLSTGTAPLGVGDSYSVRWLGKVKAPSTGTYTFYIRSDDGVRVWFDDVLKVNRWNDHAVMEDTFSMTLTAGQSYDIKIEFYENGGHSVMTMEWAGPSITRQVVPRNALFLP